jgi:methylenetetrahydrofolate dehydrogenase (NADP+)/methenyltetrahydrofolate cyclohydrolase
MAAKVFEGKKFASKREEVIKKRISKSGFCPKMVSVFFAEDAGSVLYTNLKQAAAKRVGIDFHAEKVSIRDEIGTLLRLLKKHSEDSSVHGLMIQKPAKQVFFEVVDQKWAGPGVFSTLAKNLKHLISREGMGKGTDEWWRRLVTEIPIKKDVDCLTPVNLDLVYRARWKIVPATVRAVLSILDMTGLDPVNKRVVVVGRSEIVGKPLAHVLVQEGALVKLCASTGVVAETLGSQLVDMHEPKDLAHAVSEADIVVSATGKPGIITANMIKKGAAVVDVGAPVGDVEFEEVKREASFITPVPGGVGPVTVVSLMENLLDLI